MCLNLICAFIVGGLDMINQAHTLMEKMIMVKSEITLMMSKSWRMRSCLQGHSTVQILTKRKKKNH
ncbi:hypothetical protein HanXRQr2_Chr17g0794031 [Helianthus annuus]|uniref:Uncharacterized protein n=1 Tax=Helianthus annuus TaxID=4232 RepID=A0A251RMT8_HELAN|nr:hypothetical protein HanXRQr2_Chr17g0794031 [Helianthus annuus]KAJ0812442.1 hypothetical protein HanPSC8_Chr17g0762081 [Helianthus annuus]